MGLTARPPDPRRTAACTKRTRYTKRCDNEYEVDHLVLRHDSLGDYPPVHAKRGIHDNLRPCPFSTPSPTLNPTQRYKRYRQTQKTASTLGEGIRKLVTLPIASLMACEHMMDPLYLSDILLASDYARRSEHGFWRKLYICRVPTRESVLGPRKLVLSTTSLRALYTPDTFTEQRVCIICAGSIHAALGRTHPYVLRFV